MYRAHRPLSSAVEQRLELLEVLTDGAVGDFFGGALVSGHADMAKLGNPKPFTWTSDPNKIIAAVRRGHQVLDSVH